MKLFKNKSKKLSCFWPECSIKHVRQLKNDNFARW